MMSADQRRPETTSRQKFQDSLRLLDGITSRHVWSSVLMMLLLPGPIVLLWFPSLVARLNLFHELDGRFLVGGLLGLMWIISGVTLYQQRRRLKLFRAGLIEQMDAATRNRVRAEKFYGLAILDPLTGLYNRRFGETRLQEEIARAEKSGEPLLLLALDFDRFKEINDKYGHAAGDLALKEFSRRLQRAIRACDVAIRAGAMSFM
jgi:predicted signal transduction protein with EAL and GGDEF domain